MESYEGKKLTDGWRIALLAMIVVAGVVFLARALYRVQVIESSDFSRDQARQSIRRVQVPGPRGRIYDRNGVCLAENRASYCIAFYVEELRKKGKWIHTINAVDKEIDRLASVLGVPREMSYSTVSNHVIRSLPMPLLAWRDVSQEVLARWAEQAESFPGVDVYVQPERSYPQGSLAAHVVGYVRRDRPRARSGEKSHFYLPEMFGANGIESQYNEWLTGQLGEQLIRVDARGYKRTVWQGQPSVVGHDLRLTLDVQLQQVLERTLQGRKGAGVVMDPRNGEILAMASAPTYDANEFLPVIRPDIWKRLNEDPAIPLYNRAIQGRYAPGSTFKPVTALAALLQPSFSPDEEYVCDGTFVLGTMRLRCWNTYGHGTLALRKAIEQSCNSYFCHLGHQVGYPALYEQAHLLGLGQKTGIDLPSENAGLLPSEEWKAKNLRDPWRPGDTCQIAIGQSLLLTTPLQMAALTATLANRGKVFRPHLVKNEEASCLVRQIDWPASALDRVHEGMHDVASVGTGRRVKIRGTEIAAKTGTAEYDVAGVRHKNTWVTAFAPLTNACMAVAIVVEDGVSGGQTVAPMVRELMVAVFGEPEIPSDEMVPAEAEAAEQSITGGD